jgi:pSer/pThr/pTyr-binding forkhead associated (FHA) protein
MTQVKDRFPMLIVKSPQGGTREVEIVKPSFTIGRRPDNDLCLEDPAVSGHHAKVVKIQEVLFLEDLQSTNGTMVNDAPIDRKQLRDADIIRIGLYRIIYRHDCHTAPSPSPLSPPDTDKTILVANVAEAERRPASQPVGLVRVTAGKTDQSEYVLMKQVSTIGSQDEAAIRLTGWFAPKVAAIITRRPDGYTVTRAEGGKRVCLNGTPVNGQANLAEGDVIDVAGVRLHFSLRRTQS